MAFYPILNNIYQLKSADTFFFCLSSTRVILTKRQLFKFISMPGPNNYTVRKPYRIALTGTALNDNIFLY
jgi:hypothetical protein